MRRFFVSQKSQERGDRVSTLNLNDLIQISVVISPSSAVGPSFNQGLIVGASAVIAGTTADRTRTYSSTNGMTTDGFSSTSPEYLAAEIYFGQTPQPTQVVIGRWNSSAETALAAVQACRALNPNWYLVTVCSASAQDVLMISAYINSCQPAAQYFVTTADAAVLAGTLLAAGFLIGGTGPATDIHLGTGTTLKIAVDTAVYGLTPTYSSVTLTLTGLTTGVLIASALQAAIQALGGIYAAVTVAYQASPTACYIVTSATKGPLSSVRIAIGAANDVAAALMLTTGTGSTATDGVGSVALALMNASYMRTLTQYSAQTPNAVVGAMGYAMGSNTGTANSSFVLADKVITEVTPEPLTEAQAAIFVGINGVGGDNVNFVANYNNTYTVFENGKMANGMWFDEILGLDQLVSQIVTAVMNLKTDNQKIPYTEGGMTSLRNAIKVPLNGAVTTGFLAPGTWNGPPLTVGNTTLNTGDTLSEGYLVLSAPISSQSSGNRSARISPPIYVLSSLAGAIQGIVIAVQVPM
jgi:hypothetical protein